VHEEFYGRVLAPELPTTTQKNGVSMPAMRKHLVPDS